jgi:Holliday junction resolvase RusA-like endonuclease
VAGRAVILEVDVPGVPVPQGSKRAFRHSKTGKVVMIDDNINLSAWRQVVTLRTRRAWGLRPPQTGAVAVQLIFRLPRPEGHMGTGRNAGTRKPSSPLLPAVKPDLDKLIRAVLDSLTNAGVWEDDGRVVSLACWKFYADHGRRPGVHITVSTVEEGEGQ